MEVVAVGEAVEEEAEAEPTPMPKISPEPISREAVQQPPEAKEAGPTGAPDTQTCPHPQPAGSIGPMGRGRGFVPTDTTVLGGTLRVRSPVTIETSSPGLKWK